MGIPTAASMHNGDDNTFDRLLQDSVAKEETSFEQEAQADAERSEIESELGNDNDTPTPQRTEDRGDEGEGDDVVATDTEESVTDLDDDVTESIQRGEPEQASKTAGKGTDSPRTFTPTSEPLVAAAMQNQNAGQAGPAIAQAQPQTTNPARSVEPTMRGSINGTTQNKTAPKAADVQGAYSARTAAQAQMLEQARDSVFKQIMMKMHGEGGEVRMRLEPPELGQLDLRMTVESGNKLSLTLSADRSDINQLLHRHLEELKQTLQANGLEITDAEVQTRSEFESQQAQRDAHEGAVASGESADETDSAPQPQGFVTSEGLDFLA